MAARRDAGFTLLEIMLVVVLISIAATFVVINLERDPDQIAEQEAKRFMALIEHVRGEAVLTGRTMGIHVEPDERSYRFLRVADGWADIIDDDVLRPRVVPEFLSIEIKIDPGDESTPGRDDDAEDESGDEVDDPDVAPDTSEYIIVNTLGEITPFSFRVRGEDYDFVVTLEAGQALSLAQRNRQFS